MIKALIDGDIIAYQICANNEYETWVGETNWGYETRPEVLKAELDVKIIQLMKEVKATDFEIYFTGDANFRKQVLPSYKGNRKDARKPLYLQQLKAWALEHYGDRAHLEMGLEADDLLGIRATDPSRNYEQVIISLDKDLQTIPAWVYRPGKDTCPRLVTEAMADDFFLRQVLSGDQVDGYFGCPGIGEAKAKDIVQSPFVWFQNHDVFKSGKRKGEPKITWDKIPIADPWEAIISTYEKAGLTEADAITQARCARILRHGEYDFTNRKVDLWNPSKL